MGAICGIWADLNNEVIIEKMENMCKVMKFRGPDQLGYHIDKDIGLGACIWKFNEDYNQPVYSEDRTIVGLMDGEIYNWKELSGLLESRGHYFSKNYDAEIIPHLYEEYGENFPLRCNGIFGMAILDNKAHKLLLARDHMGSKTLFYAKQRNSFCFAATIRGLLSSGLVEPNISPNALNLYFANTCVPHPKTMFEGIFSLRPGYALLVDEKGTREHKYWDLEAITEDCNTPARQFEEQIRTLVFDAIKLRASDDVSIGSVLSGGVDSSTIVSVLHDYLAKPIEVFSIGYEEKEYDDSNLQGIMLAKCGLIENSACLKPQDVEDLILKVVENLDYPVNNASAMGTYRCFELARNKVQVVFEGEGADELFCGGGGVVGENLIENLEFIPVWIRRNVFGRIGNSMNLDVSGIKGRVGRFAYRLAMPPHNRMLTWLPAFDDSARRKLLTPDFFRMLNGEDVLFEGKEYLQASKLKDKINLYQYGACKTYLCNDLLFKNERMAAANGIINRTPFMDYRLAELAFKIPAKYKLKRVGLTGVEKKWIYRKALQGLIPDEILWRKKTRGFSQPTSMWMRRELKAFVQDVLLSELAIKRGIFRRDYLRSLLDQHFTGTINQDRHIWSLLTFELWMQEHADKHEN